MSFCESGRLPEEGTPKLVLKEEQGLVKAEEGSLADEMGSDAGWPGTQSTRHRIWWEGGLETNLDFNFLTVLENNL